MTWGDWIALASIVFGAVSGLLTGLWKLGGSTFRGMRSDMSVAKGHVETIKTDMAVLKEGMEQVKAGQQEAKTEFGKVWEKLQSHDEKLYQQGVKLAHLHGRSEGANGL